MKRLAVLLLILTTVFGLAGCARLFVTEYRDSAPYVDAPADEASGTEIRRYTDLTRALRGMVADYTEQETLVFTDYDGIISDDLSKACWELRSGTALGAYCVQNITYEIQQVVAYCEADVVITYKRSGDEVRSIYSAQTPAAVESAMVDALRSDKNRFAIQISSATIDESIVQDLLNDAIVSNPLVAVTIPEAEITMYTGDTQPRIFEIRLNDAIRDDVRAERRAALEHAVDAIVSSVQGEGAERIYAVCDLVGGSVETAGDAACSAYDVLVDHRGDSRAVAMALKAVCDRLDISCEIVTGQLDSYFHTWNIIEIDGERYHIDLTGYAGTLWFCPDNIVWGRYWWNTESHDPCTAEAIVWSK